MMRTQEGLRGFKITAEHSLDPSSCPIVMLYLAPDLDMFMLYWSKMFFTLLPCWHMSEKSGRLTMSQVFMTKGTLPRGTTLPGRAQRFANTAAGNQKRNISE